MVNLELLDAQSYARVVRAREESKQAYASTPDEARVLLMLDLVSSTNHRFFRGAPDAYQRTVVFYSVCQNIFGYAPTIHILKEVGDGILAVAVSSVEALEACFLLKRTELTIRREFPDDTFPFGVRIGLGYGPVRRLASPRPDFLGSAIDELSRIMTDKSVDTGLLLSRAFRDHAASELARYSFARLGPMRWWKDPTASLAHAPIEYYALDIDIPGMPVETDDFQAWAPLGGARPLHSS